MRNIVVKGSAAMKHVLASLTIGACLLLPSAGVVLGAGPPTKPTQNPTTGQHGSNHGFSCTTSGAGINTPGNAIAAPGSPFNPSGQAGTVYAGNPGTEIDSARKLHGRRFPIRCCLLAPNAVAFESAGARVTLSGAKKRCKAYLMLRAGVREGVTTPCDLPRRPFC